MTKVIPHLSKKLRIGRWITWSSFILLLLVLLLNGVVSKMPVSLMIFTFVPLLILVPGLYVERYKTISMLCFVTLLYFVVTVSNLFAADANAFDVAELVLLVVLFNAAMMFSRWKQYSLYQDDMT
jgi:uncharacterized membrane protein|tara:strand:- start:13609 stop:13983 length:375 start_codon:yes stop_codon:yes gene_type:complete